MELLEAGRTCWRVEQARRAAFLIDYQDYYTALIDALAKAQCQILLLGWSFDPRTRLAPDGLAGAGTPDAVGRMLIALAASRPELDIKVLIWRSALAVSATQGFFPHRAKGWFKDTRVDFRLDDTVPFGACHHQKVIVIDDAFAFCGSGDLMQDRWDTVAHTDQDMRRRGPGKACHAPRHEVMMALEGDIAAALGDLARERWVRSGGDPITPPVRATPSAWPDDLVADLTDATLGIARTEPAWRGAPEVREVEELTFEAIRKAKRTIYIENQYFTSPVAAEALAARLEEPDGPEVVLISTLHSVSYFDRLTMDRTRQILLWRLRSADIFGRLRFFAPTTAGGLPIIVHAKVMVIDDTLARVGSANLNNRSTGFDTECDLAVEATDDDARAAVEGLRDRLAGHWFGRTGAVFAEERARRGSLIGAIDSLNRTSGRLAPLQPHPMGPMAEFIARFHIGDPMSAGDSWKPFRRREQLFAELRALGASDQLEVHDQRQVVGGEASQAVVGCAHGQDPDPRADKDVVDAEDRHG